MGQQLNSSHRRPTSVLPPNSGIDEDSSLGQALGDAQKYRFASALDGKSLGGGNVGLSK
jgi:hypothetical protein